MTVEKAASPTAQQVSSESREGKPTLSVLARRTYAVGPGGRCEPLAEQSPLVEEPQQHPDLPDILIADTDLVAFKPRTDVVVHGHVYGDGSERSLTAVVRVDGQEKRLQVFGERRVALRGGRLVFSPPDPLTCVPLSWTRAYGGGDTIAEALFAEQLIGHPVLAELGGLDLETSSPFYYPRNPCGRGYLIAPHPEAVDLLELPQLEDPLDLLTPERVLVGEFDRWYRMPLPQGTGWVNYPWYPRIAYFGIVPACEGFAAPPLEVERGLVSAELATGDGRRLPEFAFEVGCGAPLGLQLPYVRSGKAVELERLHPDQPRWRVVVPPAPALAIDARKGQTRSVEPVLSTLLLEPDHDRVTVVWRGTGPAIRPYGPDELARMPLRVEWRG